MSFGVGVGDIIAVANVANKVRKRFVDSPEQFKAVADEVKSLSNVLRDLEDVIPERTITDQQKAELKDTLQGCRNTLTALDQVLDKYDDLAPTPARTGLAHKSRRLWKRLTFEPEDVSDLRSRLTSNIGLFNAFIGRLALGVSHATKIGVDRLNSYQDKEEYLKVLEWLSNTDYPAQQNYIYRYCQEGTGQWLLESNDYKKWIDGAEPTLFCSGIPGAGKTFLTSIVIHDLHERFDEDPEVAIACLYFNYKRHAEQTVENLLASLLKQLIQERSELYSNLESLYISHNERRTRPSVDELSKTLHAAINGCNKAFIVIDALDECTESKTRLKLLKEVTALQDQQGRVRFLTTSRFVPDIVSEFNGKPTVEIRADDGDVRRYLEHHLEDLPLCVQRNQALQARIVTEISRAVDGMFLLAQLHLGSLSDKTTVKAVKLALQQMPRGSQSLSTAYDKTIERIDNQQPGFQQLAKQALSWIVYATRQLSVMELRHALAVEDEATELDEENLTEADEIVSACAGLVTIEEDTNIIRLVHYTTQEYLERKLLTLEPLAEEAIARTCLNYLSLDIFTPKNPDFPNPDFPRAYIYYNVYFKHEFDRAFGHVGFLHYAIDAWHSHAKHCWSHAVEQLVISFLERNPQILCYGALRYIGNDAHVVDSRIDVTGLKAIHFAALFGLDKIVAALLQAECHTRSPHEKQPTPLAYAASFGHHAAARLLLKDANNSDLFGFTPLHHAARNGHENVVELLLNCEGIDVNAQEFRRSDTPLNLAIAEGHERVVRLLLERDEIDLGCGPFAKRDTALMSCAFSESSNVLQQLLTRDDVHLNCRNDLGKTALMLAAEYGNENMFKQLLENPGVEVHYKDYKNKTVLMLAVEALEMGTVELLLCRQDIDVNCKDDDGRTALMIAVTEPFNDECDDTERTLRILLEKEKLDINCRDKDGRTALMFAAEEGRYSVVDMLLMKEEIDVNCQDNEDQTSLMIATIASYYHTGTERYRDFTMTIRKLLDDKKTDVNCRNKDGRTALMLAAKRRRYNLVKILLERDDIDMTGSEEDEKCLRDATAFLGISI